MAIALLVVTSLADRLVLGPRLERMRVIYEKTVHAKRIAHSFSIFLAGVCEDEVSEDVLDDDDFSRAAQPLEKTIPELMMSKGIKDVEVEELECIVVLWLAFHWIRTKSSAGGNALEIFNILDETFRSSFPTLRLSDKSQRLMVAYQKMNREWKVMDPKPTLHGLFRGHLSANEYGELLFRFLTTAGQQHYYQFLAKEQSERLRAHLVRLVTEGRLSSRGLKLDVLERLQDEVRKYGATSDVFLIFKNKFYEIDSYLESLPNFKPRSAVVPKGLGGGHDSRIYQIAVKTKRHYRDANHFIEDEIRPRIKTRDGFLAVAPLDLEGHSIFPTEKDFTTRQIVPAVTANYKTVCRLLTGIDRPDLDIWMLLARHEIPVEEILSNLPLTLLAENLSDSAANELWSKDSSIKKRFRIKTITDWAVVPPLELASYLSSNVTSLSSVAPQVLERECSRIVAEARRMKASLSPLQESIDGEHPERSLIRTRRLRY